MVRSRFFVNRLFADSFFVRIWEQKIFVFSLSLGLVLRLVSLNQSLWLDEATTALVAKMSFTDIFTKFLPGDFHPPLYYLLIKVWVFLFGNSEVVLRIPSVIFGLGTIVFTYLIAKELFGIRVANIVSFLTATSGLLIYYSQEARMYSMAVFLVSSVFYFWIKKCWFWFSLFLFLLGLVDYVALFVVPVFLICEKNRKKLILSFLPLFLGFAVWLPVFLKQFYGGLSNTGNAWWNILGALNLKNIALIPVKFVLGRISFDDRFLYFLIACVSISLFFYLLFRSFGKNKVILLWFVLPIFIGVIMSIKIPILYYFRFIFCLPAFYILVSSGLSTLRGIYFKAILFVVVFINIFSSIFYLTSYRFQREDWRLALRTIGNDFLIMPNNTHKEAVIYYGKEDNLLDIGSLKGDENYIWLSRYVWEITDPQDYTRLEIEKLGFEKVGEYNFNGVVFWKYQNKR